MAWYDDAIFYHIYPLGLTGAPQENAGGEPVPRLRQILPWIDHIQRLSCTALYLGPVFQSGSHGYDTTDYRTVDVRLGTNEDLKALISKCHAAGIRVVLDGVFNHVGRGFFAFQDLKHNREHSDYRDWFCDVNFYGNNEYQDGFSYGNWGGYNLLVKLNQRNPQVRDYLLDVVKYWVNTFEIDGLRLDAADVLDFSFMQALRALADTIKPEFWLMGEVIHGDYSRWVNGTTLHSVTDYALHKALYSGHNDQNYFEIAHTVDRTLRMAGGDLSRFRLYLFVDNHDVTRISSKLSNPAHYFPVHVLLYTLPGMPSIYYGSEFALEGTKRQNGPDDDIRPALDLESLQSRNAPSAQLLAALGRIRNGSPALQHGSYRQLYLSNEQYAFSRSFAGETAVVMVNNADHSAALRVNVGRDGIFTEALSGKQMAAEQGCLVAELPACSGEIWLTNAPAQIEPVSYPVQEPKISTEAPHQTSMSDHTQSLLSSAAEKSYEEMTIPELQAQILSKLAQNGPVTDRMRREVAENVYHDSLVNWVKSFR